MGRMAERMSAERQHAHIEDVRWLHNFASHIEKPAVVQVGAGSGTMAMALYEGNPLTTLWSVDNDPQSLAWEGQALLQAGFPLAPRFPKLADGADEGFPNSLSGPAGVRVDLLILDSSHEYDQTSCELLVWLPVFRDKHTVVLLHDYDPVEPAPVRYPGVAKAANEVMAELGWEVAGRFGWSAILRPAATIEVEPPTTQENDHGRRT